MPDEAQVQIILGSLLGDARIEGGAGARRLSISEAAPRERYVWWKYERLAALADEPPMTRDGRVSFRTIAHPLFDEVIALPRRRVAGLLTALGRSVRRTDELSHGPVRISDLRQDEQCDLIRE